LDIEDDRYVTFSLGDMVFEYDEVKNRKNIENHGISFVSAARIFFDYDRIELYDEENSTLEERYNTIGDLSAGSVNLQNTTDDTIVNIGEDDVVFVVYTEKYRRIRNDKEIEVTRLISARFATSFERGMYYGKY
jgi:hypothetical protein